VVVLFPAQSALGRGATPVEGVGCCIAGDARSAEACCCGHCNPFVRELVKAVARLVKQGGVFWFVKDCLDAFLIAPSQQRTTNGCRGLLLVYEASGGLLRGGLLRPALAAHVAGFLVRNCLFAAHADFGSFHSLTSNLFCCLLMLIIWMDLLSIEEVRLSIA